MKTLILSLFLTTPALAGLQPITKPGSSAASSVNAGSLVNGPLDSAILPSTVAYTSVANTFTTGQVFVSSVSIATTTLTLPLMVQANSSAQALRLLGRNNLGTDEAELYFTKYDGSTAHGTISGVSGHLRMVANSASMSIGGASGNVGIGTNSPSAKLQVVGGAVLLDNAQAYQIKDSGGSGRTVVEGTSGDILNIGDTGGWSSIAFRPGSATKATLESGGDFGIGTTNPGRALHVSGSTPEFLITSSAGGTDLKNFDILANTGITTFRALNDALSAAPFTFMGFDHANGNVGVNNSAPAYKLDVTGSIRATTGINASTATFGSGLTVSTFTSTGSLELYSGSTIAVNGSLIISTAASVARTGVPAIAIDAQGFVGLGTNAPSNALTIDSPNAGMIDFKRSGTLTGQIDVGSSALALTASVGQMNLTAASGQSLNLKIGGATKVSIGSAGDTTFTSTATISGLDIIGGMTAASLRTHACTGHATRPCLYINTTDNDLYTSTGTAANQSRNTRTGTGP